MIERCDLPSIEAIAIDMTARHSQTGSGYPSPHPHIAHNAAQSKAPTHSDSKSGSALSDEITSGHMNWNESIETMLAKWCDEAKCFEWMHVKAYTYFEKRARIIGVSSAVLTALSGFANVILGSNTVGGFQFSWVFGGLSILISIIGILQDKLAYNRLAAEHRQFSIQWSIIRRKIEEELSIPPESRRECVTFLKYMRQDINQVSVDGNAQIPERIRISCFETFKHVKDFDLPDICGDMEHTRVYERCIIEATPATI